MITHTLDEAMERLPKNHYHLWKALYEAWDNPTRLEEWRRARAQFSLSASSVAERSGIR
jgi:hypothetical protein